VKKNTSFKFSDYPAYICLGLIRSIVTLRDKIFHSFLLFAGFFIQLSAQSNLLCLQIQDMHTQKPVPFVSLKITPDNKQFISGLDGKIIFASTSDTLTFRFYSSFYYPKTLRVLKDTLHVPCLKIFLSPVISELMEISVSAGEDPALEIIRKCRKQLSKTDPRTLPAFSVQKHAQMKVMISDSSGNEDFYKTGVFENDTTTFRRYRKFIEKKFAYFFENQSIIAYRKNTGMKEKILYARAPGFERSPFSLFFAALQSFGFYEEQIQLLDESYLSPLARDGEKYYRYRIRDTMKTNTDTFYVIDIEPKKKSVYSLLRGQLYIHATLFYLKGVDVKPSAFTGKYLYATRQFYSWLPEKVTLPDQTETYLLSPIESSNEKLKNIDLYIKFRMEMRLNNFRTDSVPEIRKNTPPFEEAEKLSPRPLFSISDPDSLRNSNTIVFADSIGKEYRFEKKLRLFSYLIQGEIPWGVFSFTWPDLLRYNLYEGFAPGTRITFREKRSGSFYLFVQGRYGFSDKDWKAGAGAGITKVFHGNHLHQWEAGWIKDLVENGSTRIFLKQDLFSQEGLRNYYIQNMDGFQGYYFQWNYRLPKNWELLMTQYFLQWKSLYGYRLDNNIYSPAESRFSYGLMNMIIRYKHGQYWLRGPLGTFPYNEKELSPEVQINYKKNFPVPFFPEKFVQVHRLDISYSQGIHFRQLRGIWWMLKGGYAFETSHYQWLYHHHASRYGDFSISYPLGMETMFYQEFMSENYTQFHVMLFFKKLIPYNDWINPSLQLVHNVCIGQVNHPERYTGIPLFVPEKPYTECGIRIQGLFKSSFNSMGIGVFYRYGNYAHPDMSKNIVLKLTASVKF